MGQLSYDKVSVVAKMRGQNMKWKQLQVNNTNNLELVIHCPCFIVMYSKKEYKYGKVSAIE